MGKTIEKLKYNKDVTTFLTLSTDNGKIELVTLVNMLGTFHSPYLRMNMDDGDCIDNPDYILGNCYNYVNELVIADEDQWEYLEETFGNHKEEVKNIFENAFKMGILERPKIPLSTRIDKVLETSVDLLDANDVIALLKEARNELKG